ncbi:MAG: 2-octaprenyl-6-methoxyphenyl hydroxylase [Oceanospirillaceae bacterium]|uniref:2-octaprenyl-6-methoxyphenyl hydroxylase n=1 Tax=unclassified Thalassolituus TaxID=2624967 RepID=UPI000C65C49F|nr:MULTISPECIES: 2-octaprenyl-6-methoxyphenyl hydroxylase [unclassified Thalassolituus]MAS25482.1 2-octaprenyl-6-methoxyphenyl hydroxylase [Oceanospirillaceae bacterium]MBL36267.1 2-octaprenyl-6-methoxyphenyl hydroxylase [Oceanospirillaceae bacterium]MBS53784.1 2-octaprenyl-6-methoxyphenyl hydroxylase [Oceanospirillaceae bacterium]|tara:strand:+ start:760 stop:2028 length:1269 start_codon:yes stop_codon:yes gene_type:complete
MNAQIPQTDVVVLGAGMVGASLVHLLGPAISTGLNVTLIDRHELNWDGDLASRPPSFDGRATALSYGTQQMLEQLGLWSLMQERACAIEHIQVSDQGRFGQAHLHASEQNAEALGYIVENAALGYGLLKTIAREGVDIKAPASVSAVSMNAAGALLTFADGTQLQTSLLVMADGARSPLASSLGIRHQRNDYGTHALVTQVEVDQPHGHWAYERFSSDGPIAFLPLRSNHFAVVWTLNNDEIDGVMQLSDDALLARLQTQIGYRLGRLKKAGERATYPLGLVRSSEQVRRSLVLLGNAAHSLHPVAGQGFNLAIRDTAVLAEHLNRAFAQGTALGDLNMLQAYERQQQADQFNTVGASDLLPKMFGSSSKVVSVLRDAGLLAMAAAPTARRLFTRHAMGLGQKAAALTPVTSAPARAGISGE